VFTDDGGLNLKAFPVPWQDENDRGEQPLHLGVNQLFWSLPEMSLFSVSYDLLQPGRNYEPLYARLRALGAKRVLYSQWMLKHTGQATDVRDDLKRYIDYNDRLLVIDATTSAMAWTSLETDIKTAFSLT
jgi:hypothetical protein